MFLELNFLKMTRVSFLYEISRYCLFLVKRCDTERCECVIVTSTIQQKQNIGYKNHHIKLSLQWYFCTCKDNFANLLFFLWAVECVCLQTERLITRSTFDDQELKRTSKPAASLLCLVSLPLILH